MIKNNNIKLITVILCIVILSGCGSNIKTKPYTDKQGRFSVNYPAEWAIQEFNDARGKVAFYKDKVNFIVMTDEYYENDVIGETEKNRIRAGLVPALKAKYGLDAQDIYEKDITVSGIKAWMIGFNIKSENMDLKMIMFIANNKMYNITITGNKEQNRYADSFIKSFKLL